MNSQLESVGKPIQLYRERSNYQGGDKDLKTSHIKQLQKNIDAIQQLCSNLRQERERCLLFLGNEDRGQDLVGVLQQKVEHLMKDVKEQNLQLKEVQKRFSDEVNALSGTLEFERQTSKGEKEGFIQELKELRRIIADWRSRDRLPSGSSVADILRADKSTQVGLYVNTRDCCTQVDLDISSSTPEEAKVMPKAATEVKIKPPERLDRGLMQISNIDAVTLAKLDVSRSVRNSTLNSDIDTLHHQMEHTVSQHSREADLRNLDQRHTINYLHHQVVNFAEKLVETKHQVELYERQIEFMKASPTKHSTLTCCKHNQSENQNPLRRWSSESFLAGKKLAYTRPDKEADILCTHLKFHKSQKRTTHVGSNGNNGGIPKSTPSKCLRCRKLYRLQDNHQTACMYHPANKHHVEKYDKSGKLLRVSLVWQCCKQSQDSPGCAVGQHI